MATIWPTVSPAPQQKVDTYPSLPANVYELRNLTRAADLLKKLGDNAIQQLMGRADATFWEMGDGEGIYYVSDILVGVRLLCNIIVFPGQTAWMGPKGVDLHAQMVRYVFRVFDIQRMGATVTVDNTLSQRLLSNLGFHQEGILRSYGYVRETMKDAYIYSLLKEEL